MKLKDFVAETLKESRPVQVIEFDVAEEGTGAVALGSKGKSDASMTLSIV
jgi:hypothetical protein